MEKKLYRSRVNRMAAGICGGLGEYFEIDPTIVRLIWVIGSVFVAGLPGVLVYVVAWFLIPEAP